MIGFDVEFKKEGDVVAKLKQIRQIPYVYQRNIMIECPVKTSRLRGSTEVVEIGENAWIVGTKVAYAPMVEFGTAPHVIRPTSAKALHWKQDGADRFAKVVHHPGTEPNPYFERGIDRGNREVDLMMKQ